MEDKAIMLVHRFIQEAAKVAPGKAAVICGDEELSYRELVERMDF
jgi:non-ribosomal peptide synthetase component E (peptide arylation enzyme)